MDEHKHVCPSKNAIVVGSTVKFHLPGIIIVIEETAVFIADNISFLASQTYSPSSACVALLIVNTLEAVKAVGSY